MSEVNENDQLENATDDQVAHAESELGAVKNVAGAMEGTAGDKEGQEGEEELAITIGEEEPVPEDDSAVLRDLRKRYRDTLKEKKALQDRLEASKPKLELGAEPTLESCDFDTDVYKTQLADYLSRKRSIEEEQNRIADEEQAQARAWQERLDSYETAKTQLKLKVRDFDDAENMAREILSPTQFGIIVQGAKNPEYITYVLGNNPTKARELAKISNPINFSVAIGELSKELNVKKRSPQTTPDTPISGSSGSALSTDDTLDRLRAEAEKTGDHSKVLAYKKKLREKKS